MSGDIVKTEVKLSEDSIQKILAAQVAKAMIESPKFLSNMVEATLSYMACCISGLLYQQSAIWLSQLQYQEKR